MIFSKLRVPTLFTLVSKQLYKPHSIVHVDGWAASPQTLYVIVICSWLLQHAQSASARGAPFPFDLSFRCFSPSSFDFHLRLHSNPNSILSTEVSHYFVKSHTMAQPKSRLPLLIGTAAAGGVGYYLYTAGGNPKVAEKQFEGAHQSSKLRSMY